MKTIAIAGASLAGLRGAEALRSTGFDGRLVLIGEEEHLPYDRPPLSKEVLRGDWGPEKASLVRGDSLEKLELDLRLGRRAVALDADAREVRLDDGDRVAFDGLLIATGASARRLPGAPELEGLHTLRTLDDALALRRELEQSPRVAVVGAGFIGAEVAASCRQLGLEVTMIEALPVPLPPALGEDVGRALARVHEEHGVSLKLGVGVDEVEGDGRVSAVRLVDGTRVDADVVVVGIGVVPNTDWLEGSGVEVSNGVVCDEACRASVPGIVAAGDVARWSNPLFGESMRIEHWSNAAEQAMAAAASLLAREAPAAYASVPFFWSDQYHVKIQSAGFLAGSDASKVVHGSIEEGRFLKLYGRAGRWVGALAFNEPRRLIKCRRQLREVVSFDDAVARHTGE
ncbi:MAG: NAD(P)/FAD-dependent oxidoreductase [Myxococcota bacterium]